MALRPATPGFLVTLVATILLAVVSFNVPILKSVFFLQASLSVENIDGSITLGTLGYCIKLSNGTTCSSPSVGYEFDPNKLLGDSISFAQIPEVFVKWITYGLFLHVIALILSAGASIFGLLAHVREFSMTCCSTCISGFAATIALVSFIFDLVLFFIVKSRIKGIGGTATFGSAIWLTLAAWVLLFFSGCFYSFGRCCISNRPRGPRDSKADDSFWNRGDNSYAEQMRLDAVKAEADRKARQGKEVGLPAFPEQDVTKPLAHDEDESDSDYVASLPSANGRSARGQYRGGYAQAPPGSRAMDEYYSPTRSEGGYPPQSRQNSLYSKSSIYSQRSAPIHSSPPPIPSVPQQNQQYLAVGNAGQHSQYPSGRDYGHSAGGTSYYSAASQPPHQQQASAYSAYNDPYGQQQQQHQQRQSSYSQANADAYGGYEDPYTQQPYNQNVAQTSAAAYGAYSYGQQHTSPPPQQQQSYNAYAVSHNTPPPQPQPTAYSGPVASSSQAYAQADRNYTLGGGEYGAYSGSPATNAGPSSDPYAFTYYGAHESSPQQTPLRQPQPYNAATFDTSAVTSTTPAAAAGPAGPRSPRSPPQGARPRPDASIGNVLYPPTTSSPEQIAQTASGGYEDAPPGYEAGPSRPAWAEKS